MTKERKNEIAKNILFWILNNDESFTLRLCGQIENIARDRSIPVEEVEELLQPFERSALKDKTYG